MSEQPAEYNVNKTIIRVAKNADNPFVMMDKRPLEKPYLSWKAKGLLAYLLSRPDDWTVRLGDLVKRSTDGEYATRQAIKELESAGHITKTQERKDGQFAEVVYTVYEQPLRGNPQAGNPQAENLALTNTNVTKKDNTNTRDWKKLRQEAQERKDNKPDKSIVDAYVEAAQSEGMQKSNRYDAILSQIGVALNIYVDFKRWEQFIKFVDTRQQKHNESLDVFFRWLKEQKGFDISYWPPHKLVENWPRAFSQPEVIDKRHEL